MHPRTLLLGLLVGLLTSRAAAATDSPSFHTAWWCRDGDLQTVWAALFRPTPRVPLTRTRWELPDGDFLDIDELVALPDVPRVIVLHGLESSSRSKQVLGILRLASRRGWGGIAVNFRGCSGEPNRLRRSYHGGETADLAWIVQQVAAHYPSSPLLCVGFSLGGNVLLKYLGEQGDAVPSRVQAAVAISAPLNLAASAHALERGFSRVYMHQLVRSLVRKTRLKLQRYPDLVDARALSRVRTLAEFDELVTAPLHGFANAAAYWSASSSQAFLGRIRRPTLLINAKDDPFLPASELPMDVVAANPFLTAEFPDDGGHMGFLTGRWPAAPVAWAEVRAMTFLDEHRK